MSETPDLRAVWTPDTRCAICGQAFDVGDRAWVRCAVNAADAVWEHDSCSDAVLAELEERL